MLVFVYGSLMRGEEYHGPLAGSARLGRFETAPEWHFWDLGGYPAMTPGGTRAVEGEVYRIDRATLAELDRIEEVPTLYQRAILETAWGPAQVYVVGQRPADARPLPPGRWSPATHRT